MDLSGLTSAQQKAVLGAISGQQVQTKWNNYYSRVRVSATSLVANSYIVAPGNEFIAFGYSRNSDMAAA